MAIIPLLIVIGLTIFVFYGAYRFFNSQKDVAFSAGHEGLEEGQATDLKCIRCFDSQMIYNGTERFHVGSNSAPFVFGNFGELFVNKQTFDMYYCPICGKVEFFFRQK